MLSRLEVLLDAIASANGSKDPTSPGYRARNPLCLQNFTPEGRAMGTIRRFNSLHGGLLACLYDLKIKASGKSRAKLDGENFTISGLMRVYNMKDSAAIPVCRFLRRALDDQSIRPDTKLSYFLEDEVKSNVSARAETREQVMTNG